MAGRLDDLERTIERVRGLFEAHFLGLERRAPEPQRLEMQRKLNEARKIPVSNTALKFRSDTLVQRVTVLSAYWNRTLREIEQGTYRRDVFKAERHMADRAKANPTQANPTQANPTQANPTLANPTLANPTLANPTLANPTLANPAQANPAQANPAKANPALANPAKANPAKANPATRGPVGPDALAKK